MLARSAAPGTLSAAYVPCANVVILDDASEHAAHDIGVGVAALVVADDADELVAIPERFGQDRRDHAADVFRSHRCERRISLREGEDIRCRRSAGAAENN